MHPWLSPLLAAHGFATVSPTYRLSGTATWPAQLDDARDALGWVRTHATDFGGDPDRIGVWGFSAGAHLAALLALTEGDLVSAAALAACPADLRGVRAGADDEVAWLLGGTPTPERLDEISPVCRVGASVPPLLIAHGSDDEIVPIAQAEALRDVARAAGGVVEWHEIVGARHSWADAPTAGLDEEAPSFGTLAADFFEWHLVFPA